jgi:NAD(P)-dependent dehydrogenase (short-subunit alcohol dehydrogenase family)
MSKKTALITGGARGIGLGVAKTFAAGGYNLALCGRKPADAVSGEIAELQKSGAEVLYVPADISLAGDREKLVSAVASRFGALHVLVNNAGIAPTVRADLLDAGEASFDQLIGVNLKGPYFLTQAVAKLMAAQNGADANFRGCIIFVTSCSAEVVSTNRGDYCLSKAALSMAAKLYAARMAAHNVSVYEIRPGVIRTDMTAGVTEKYDRLIASGLTLEKRWGLPEDIGKTAFALAEGMIPYATGQVIKIDGGMTVQQL